MSWSSPGAVFTRYDASAAAELASVSPRASGMAERRLLTVRGANLAPTPGLACSFAGVAVTPGLDFGAHHHPERYLRLAYTCEESRLHEALERLRAYLERP